MEKSLKIMINPASIYILNSWHPLRDTVLIAAMFYSKCDKMWRQLLWGQIYFVKLDKNAILLYIKVV